MDSITAGVVEERPGGINEIVKIFKLKSEEEKGERLSEIQKRIGEEKLKKNKSTATAYLNFKKNEIELSPYSITEQNKRFSDETPEEYAERIRLLGDFNFIDKISQEFATQTGIGLHTQLSWREQQWLAASIAHIPGQKEKIITQTKKHGPDFLRAFLSCEQGLEQGQNIIALAEKLSPKIADKIFAKYGEIVDTAEKITASLESDKDKLNNETLNKIRQNTLARGKNLLVKFAETTKKEKTDGDEIITELDNIRADIILFAETYRESGQPIEELQETNFGGYRSEELTATDKKQMRENAEMNMTDKDFSEQVVLPALDESFADPKNTFYLLKHGGKVVSSMRLADRGDDYYFGSFYADPNAQGAGFGQEMMTRVVAQKAMEKPVVASAVADQAPIQHYINKQGFVATKIMPDYENTGVDLFEIKLDKTSDEKPEMVGRAEKISFDLKKDRARFIQICEERLNSGEYVLTKYEVDKKGIAQCEFQKTARADAVALERIRKNINKAA